ncbi:MAG: ornithine cyclodeaminase family protein [Pseudomonadota bacterium]|jgi:ornithine cyclodeaminase|uniref:Ornithine cyclodeaminase n=1 Tax=hydrothermal vent metagenome TaxID=652676 RepID=A0A160TM81_9ZZZZ
MLRSIPYLDAEMVERSTPMPALIAALRRAFAEGRHVAPARLATDMSDRASLLVMPAWRANVSLGVKVVEVDRDASPAIRATYLLIDRATGTPRALFDGAALTRRRTAAASVLAAGYLARPHSKRLLLLGTGALNAPLIEAYASAFPIEAIQIWGRDLAKAEVVAGAARALGYPAVATADISTALQRADIVSAATLATTPLIAGEALVPGTHVDLIGAFRPEMCEADGIAFARSRVFVDTLHGALEEAGDLLQAIAAGHFTAGAIEGDLAALCTGANPGRDGDDTAITLFKSVGTAIEDLAAAELALAGQALP